MGDRLLAQRTDEIQSMSDTLVSLGVISVERFQDIQKMWPLGLHVVQDVLSPRSSTPYALTQQDRLQYQAARAYIEKIHTIVKRAYEALAAWPLDELDACRLPEELRVKAEEKAKEAEARKKILDGFLKEATDRFMDAVHACESCAEKRTCTDPRAEKWRAENGVPLEESDPDDYPPTN